MICIKGLQLGVLQFLFSRPFFIFARAIDIWISLRLTHIPTAPSTTSITLIFNRINQKGRIQHLSELAHPNKPKIVAVLDWEISTLGDPISDLAYFCQFYHIEGNNGLNSNNIGVPSEKELLEYYFSLMGRGPLMPKEWNYYLAFSLFRLTSIIQGVYARSLQGNASSEKAQSFGAVVPIYAEKAWAILNSKE